jgi:hypothetical protein
VELTIGLLADPSRRIADIEASGRVDPTLAAIAERTKLRALVLEALIEGVAIGARRTRSAGDSAGGAALASATHRAVDAAKLAVSTLDAGR